MTVSSASGSTPLPVVLKTYHTGLASYLLTEVAFFQHVGHHPNIVRLEGVWKGMPQERRWYAVFEKGDCDLKTLVDGNFHGASGWLTKVSGDGRVRLGPLKVDDLVQSYRSML